MPEISKLTGIAALAGQTFSGMQAEQMRAVTEALFGPINRQLAQAFESLAAIYLPTAAPADAFGPHHRVERPCPN